MKELDAREALQGSEDVPAEESTPYQLFSYLCENGDGVAADALLTYGREELGMGDTGVYTAVTTLKEAGLLEQGEHGEEAWYTATEKADAVYQEIHDLCDGKVDLWLENEQFVERRKELDGFSL